MRNYTQNIASFHNPFGSSMMSYANEEFAYSFGFNTQEKDDEIYGKGNSYSAEYWQYDARLGRRWNNDPRPNPSMSVYACFGNNPICFGDPNGDTTIITNITTGEEIERFDDGRIYNTQVKVDPQYYADFKEKFIEANCLNHLATLTSQVTSANGLLTSFLNTLETEALYINHTKFNPKFMSSPNNTYNWDNNPVFLYGKKLIAKETGNSLRFNGNELVWVTTFSDGSSLDKYKWNANSGPHNFGMLPNGSWSLNFYAWNTASPRNHVNNAYQIGDVSFSINITPNWTLTCPSGVKSRDGFLIHPDGNNPGTAGCIGLVGSAAVMGQIRDVFWSYRLEYRHMTLSVDVENNPNNECQSSATQNSTCE